jgi:hypothetical protein
MPIFTEEQRAELTEIVSREKRLGRVRASKLQYVHFTDAKGALGMVKEKRIWQSEYAAPAVYAVAVGGAYVPGVQKTNMGRAKSREVAILFTTDEFPDVIVPEEVMWHKDAIRVKTARIIPAAQAKRLLDGSKVVGDTILGIPHHPSKMDWDVGRVRSPKRLTVARP